MDEKAQPDLPIEQAAHLGVAPADAGKHELAKSWRMFCDGLAEAGAETLAAAPDADDAADGIAQLGMLLEVALRWYLRGADPDSPRLIEINDTPEVADNLFAAVRGDAIYRLTGDVSTLFDLNISVHKSWAWLARSQPTGDLGRADLEIDENGRFELILGGEMPATGNWLALPADAEFIQIREYHSDFDSHRPGQYEISRIDAAISTPSRPTPRSVAERIGAALAWTQSYGAMHRGALAKVFPPEPNAIRQPAANAGGNSHIWYGFGRFDLRPSEALIVSFDKPEARLWSVQWLLDPWYESPDIVDRLTGISGHEADIDSDGRVRIVFAHSDPGIRNWLDVSGYRRGLFVTRWIWCSHGPPVDTAVVELAALGDSLPADTRFLTPAERVEQRSQRRTHFVHRRR